MGKTKGNKNQVKEKKVKVKDMHKENEKVFEKMEEETKIPVPQIVVLSNKSDKKTEEETSVKAPKVDNLDRTIFVGNLSPKSNKQHLTKLFKPYGDIESIRLRTANGKIFKRDDKDFKNEKSLNAYIVFKNIEHARKAVEFNGTVFKHNTVRVTMASDKASSTDPKTTIFVGNLKYCTTEDQLFKLFEGCGEVEYVRCIQNAKGCKGIAYVGFKNPDSVLLALEYNNHTLNERSIRVSRFSKNHKEINDKKKVKGKGKGKFGKKSTNDKVKQNKKGGKPATEGGDAGNKSSDAGSSDKPSKKSKLNFQGKKIERTKKKSKLGKGLKMKKILAKKLAPKKKGTTA